ncbi:MAG: hypothetical protein IPG23_08620 [Burkholderiales bacterium]|nr:hypothetical protein [Burkholderiales bacterium]
MDSKTLPKAIRAAINRRAFNAAIADVYPALKQDLEQRAHLLMKQPHATIDEVIAGLDSDPYVQTFARLDQAGLGRIGC